MCGIAALWGEQDSETVAAIVQRMTHRGPDGQDVFTHAQLPVVLGHSRLAIIDPQGGAQPIRSTRGDRTIVTNGEIYNYKALRQTLDPSAFTTDSDAEVALHLYERDGPACVERLDGMFALVIQDGEQLFAARDPLGIKPLYYGRRHGAWLFASEIRSLVGLAEDIREFPPGSWFHSQHGFNRYYRIPAPPAVMDEPQEAAIRQWVTALRAALERAVDKWMVSDVPVGAFLSGGLDSSIIAALARRHNDDLHTFAVGVAGSPDLLAARRVAEHIGSHHHEQAFTLDEVIEDLPAIIQALESDDVDLVRSAIPCNFVSRLAARRVKAVLTGEGADELFAGYGYYRDYRDPQALARELTRSLGTMHNINLQRVDRLTMAHSLEGRVPFLDSELIELAQGIPATLKLRNLPDGRQVEKWILRAASEDLLPQDIVWRDKAQFDEGSGTTELLRQLVARLTGVEHDPQRQAEQDLYHRLLLKAYPDPRPVLDNIGTWTERRVAA